MMKVWINLKTDDVQCDLLEVDTKDYVCVFEWEDGLAIPEKMNIAREAYFWGKYGMCFEHFMFPKMWAEKQGREWNVDEMKKHMVHMDAWGRRG